MKLVKCVKSAFCNNCFMKKLRSSFNKDVDILMPAKMKPSVYHAVIIIFLEFFAWGLLTTPMMDVLKDTFKDKTFLFNGIIQGIKGFLSFLAAPILGALSDAMGRKTFLLLSVFFTCGPIPLMVISPWMFFAMISLSGCFAVTFSIIFAYVADITDESNRSSAYGLISATFAASLVISPAVGAYMSHAYSLESVVALATLISLLDFFFIILFVPESLAKTTSKPALNWTKKDVFKLFSNVTQDKTLFLFCVTVFLSYLPEAGQYTCIFVYLRHVIGFTNDKIALYIAVVGILSILAQTVFLSLMFQLIGNKPTIVLGLLFQTGQLLCFAFGKSEWTMWLAGGLAALSSINYPSLSSLVSAISSESKQGVAQGMITGVRSLCNGLGPALFGLAFHLFNIRLDPTEYTYPSKQTGNSTVGHQNEMLPGPPFLFGAVSVVASLFFVFLLPKQIDHASCTYRSLPQQDASSASITKNANIGATLVVKSVPESSKSKVEEEEEIGGVMESSVFIGSNSGDVTTELLMSEKRKVSESSSSPGATLHHRYDEKNF